jgi:hypothetical protein
MITESLLTGLGNTGILVHDASRYNAIGADKSQNYVETSRPSIGETDV